MYCPVLKAKAGELEALYKLPGPLKNRLSLVLDVPTTGDEVDARLDDYLRKKAARIRKAWGARRVAVDIFDLEPGVSCADGWHPVERLLDCLRTEQATAVPVTGLDREPLHRDAVRRIVAQDGRDVCARILEDDLRTPTDSASALKDHLAQLGTSPGDVDLLLDLRSIRGRDLPELSEGAEGFLRSLPFAEERWRSVSISASAMPQSLAEVARPSVDTQNRPLMDT